MSTVRVEVRTTVYVSLDGRDFVVHFRDGKPNNITITTGGKRPFWHAAHHKVGGPGTIISRVLAAARQLIDDHA
jgi:hypothetical protein